MGLEADLIDRGLRLRWLWDPDDDRLTFRDLHVLISVLPLDESTFLHKSVNPDYRWTLENQLLAHIADLQGILAWQNTGDSKNRPEQIPRPGVIDQSEGINLLTDNGQANLDLDTIVDAREWLGWSESKVR